MILKRRRNLKTEVKRFCSIDAIEGSFRKLQSHDELRMKTCFVEADYVARVESDEKNSNQKTVHL